MSAVETRVARAVLRAHFGLAVEAVAWALVAGGAQTTSALVSRLATTAANPFSVRQGLPVLALGSRAVREALVVLIQHALVRVVEDPLSSTSTAGNPSGPARTARTAYLLDVRAVIVRLGLPMLIVATSDPGSDREAVLLEAVRCGRLLLSSLPAPHAAAARELVSENVLLAETTPEDDGEAYMLHSPKRSRTTACLALKNSSPTRRSPASSGRVSPADSVLPASPRPQVRPTYVRVSPDALARHVLLSGTISAVRRRINRGAAVLVHVLVDAAMASRLPSVHAHGRTTSAEATLPVPSGTAVSAILRSAEAHAAEGCAFCRVPPRSSLADILPIEWRGERSPTPEAQRRSLRVVVEHYLERACAELPFVARDVRTTSGLGSRGDAAARMEASFVLDLAAAREWLRCETALSLASAAHGPIAARILRVARAAGFVEERTVCSRALTAPIAVRTVLFALHTSGHIAQQEVPRTAERTPKSTFYLWALPRPRARLWRTCASHLLAAVSARIDAAASELAALVDPVASAMACRVLRPSLGVASPPDAARMDDAKPGSMHCANGKAEGAAPEGDARPSALGQPPEVFKAVVAACGADALGGSDALQLTDAELARLDAASAASSAAWRALLPAFREYVLFAFEF